MMNKLWFLTKMSLNKKIKTKWFYIANILFLILIVGIINIDSIINFFGGDFSETQKILIIDNANVFDSFKEKFEVSTKYLDSYVNTEVIKYDKSYDEAVEEVKKEDKEVFLVIDNDIDNYLKAKFLSQDGVGTITKTIVNSVLGSIRSNIVREEYNITDEMYDNMNASVVIDEEILGEENKADDVIMSAVMTIFMFPMFMLIMFLIQMSGAEVNEEKSTRSMEIIISNVSPRIHFMSKVLAANAFVILQGLLLIVFGFIGALVRFIFTGGEMIGELDKNIDIMTIVNSSQVTKIMETVNVMIPVLLIMILLTFLAYSLLAGILASMTTNLEDFQQLQTPMMLVLLVGFYLSTMAGMFEGSIFIKIMSYIPLVSSMLAPTLYLLGEISIYDLIISILMLVGFIYLLMKYGLRIYKVGILNYSGVGLWKKMFKAIKEK